MNQSKDLKSLPIRPRRNRRTPLIRGLVRETHVRVEQLVAPLFVTEGAKKRTPILAMPGQDRLSIDELCRETESLLKLGVRSVALFPVIPEKKKTSDAREALNPEGLGPAAIRALRREFKGDVHLIADVALDPFSSDGHDGLVKDGRILNDESLPILSEMARIQAEAGADWVAPSDMMDGRVGDIRRVLDDSGYSEVGILSYAVKYASAFYGPFREALDSAPRFGDKSTYQMDPANRREALREALLDIREGADAVMVKPGLPYLDVISDLARRVTVPVAAYQVSGEYSMLVAAAEKGWIHRERAILESLTGLHRAGARIILTYFAREAARLL